MSDIAEVRCTCGRYVLFVAGIAVAMQGDKCRDGELPEEVLDPIPQHVYDHGSIGGEPITKDMNAKLVRFFVGNYWNETMLRYAADKINAAMRQP